MANDRLKVILGLAIAVSLHGCGNFKTESSPDSALVPQKKAKTLSGQDQESGQVSPSMQSKVLTGNQTEPVLTTAQKTPEKMQNTAEGVPNVEAQNTNSNSGGVIIAPSSSTQKGTQLMPSVENKVVSKVNVVNSCQLSKMKSDSELSSFGFKQSIGVVYNSQKGKNAVANVFWAAGGSPRPVVIFNHGSGGAPYSFDGSFRRLVSEGFAVVSPGHLEGEQQIFPKYVSDLRCAIRWVRAHAKEYNFDPSRVAMTGFSMGGFLSAAFGATLDDVTLDAPCTTPASVDISVKAVISTAGMYDFLIQGPTAAPSGIADQIFGSTRNQQIMIQASAAKNLKKSTPPFLLIHGTDDSVIPPGQGDLMAKALNDVGVPNALLKPQGEGHAPAGDGQLLFVGGNPTLECTGLAFLKDALTVP